MKRWSGPGSRALLLILFVGVAWLVYAPALDGEFVSDDIHYVQGNGYLHELTVENVSAILDPTGPLLRVVENYAPVHLLLHAAAWQAFEAEVRGHHALNILMHALASCLLVLVFRRSGISSSTALLGGAFFLVHPANVEAVAWISQLKTTSAMVLCLGAMLLHPRHSALALGCFVLALLAKATAAVALFVVIAFGLARSRSGAAPGVGFASNGMKSKDWKWSWIALWAVAFAIYAVIEMTAFDQTAGTYQALQPELGIRLRTMFAVGLRYLVMATSSYGLSVFQEPGPAASLLDPWWLASLGVFGLLLWRAGPVVIGRREEGAYWVWAAVSFAPVSGVIPLPHVLADRYLYFMLPGLIGVALLAGPELLARRFGSARLEPARLTRLLTVAGMIWILAFAVRSHIRAFVWRTSETVTADVLDHYPQGRWARIELAGRAAQAGELEGAVAHLMAARERGFDGLDTLLLPRYAPLRGHPGFIALQRELASAWVIRVSAIPEPSQSDLMVRAQAHIVLGELESAREDLRRAIYAGGPMTDSLYGALDELEKLEKSKSSSPKP